MVSTITTIDGERVTLDQGTKYLVRPRDGEDLVGSFEGRTKNGTLVFVAGVTRVNLRPKDVLAIGDAAGIDRTLDAIAASLPDDEELAGKLDGLAAVAESPDLAIELAAQAASDRLVEAYVADGDRDPDSVAAKVAASDSVVSARREDETASAYLERIERGLGAAYTRWIETGPGQDALEAARREATASRKPPKRADIVERVDRETKGVLAEADAAIAAADAIAKPKASAKPYAERNQVWRCGTCKRRTRSASCSNGHPEVLAPAGKRREDRSTH